jgi:hypothetical protein
MNSDRIAGGHKKYSMGGCSSQSLFAIRVFKMLDSVRRVVVFFLFLEPRGLQRPRGLQAVVVSPPYIGTRDGKGCGKSKASEV